MKKVKPLRLICFIALAAALFAVVLFAGGCDFIFSSQDEDGDYRFHLTDYSVTYDVAENRVINVTEQLTVHYDGRDSTGIYRDIPVNGGELVKNVKVTYADGKPVYYKLLSNGYSYVTVSIGDYTKKYGKPESYTVTYDYVLTKAQEGKNTLELNPIGAGWECEIEKATAKIILPNGFKQAVCYAGKAESDNEYPFTTTQENGRTVLETTAYDMPAYHGITFKAEFNDGALYMPAYDLSTLLYAIGAVILLIILLICKFTFFNKSVLTPVVNFEAPDKLDPLLMGKLIDNKVDNEDISSILFYWADKKYLAIDLTDSNDPTLIQLVKKLPDDAADYEKLMFDSLFLSGKVVKSSSLSQKFYTTTQRVTAKVNAKAQNLYKKQSLGVAFALTVLSGIVMAVAPLLYAYLTVSHKFIYLWGLISLVPSIGIYILGEHIAYNNHKYNAKKKALFILLLVCAGLLGCGLYMLVIPNYIFPLPAKFLLSFLSLAVSAASASLISRTDEYTKQLNDIVGFKNFIALAEKDKLEKMIDDDPQFYYHILPYAQVLGVSDVWEEKFKDITVPPPQWCTTHMGVMDFYIINRLVRSSTVKFSASMVSRPAPSGKSGFGGFGGGHVGGGHGGGGGRGR